MDSSPADFVGLVLDGILDMLGWCENVALCFTDRAAEPAPTQFFVATSRGFDLADDLLEFSYTLVSRKKCTNPCSCETIVCTIPVASAAWCDRQA